MGLCVAWCFGFGFVVGVVVVVDSAGAVEGAGSVVVGAVVVGGGVSGFVSGTVIVGAVDAGGMFGFFFLHAGVNATLAASSNMPVARSTLTDC